MSNVAWYGKPSPPHVGKILVLELMRPGIMPIVALDTLVGALKQIDNGSLWRHGQPFPFPDGGPEAFSINSNATYHDGTVTLTVIAQIPTKADRTGLFLTFTDQPREMPLPWMGQTSEIITAVTLLHVGTVLRQTLVGDADGDPTRFWQWHDGCWLNKGTPISYNGWRIVLER
jgi:hypothetical protein